MKGFVFAALLLMSPQLTAQPTGFIDSLIAEMTIEEKLGQLTLHVGRSTEVGPRVQERGEDVIRRGRVGALYNVYGAEYTREIQRIAVEQSRLGIPLLFSIDVLHGFRTTFPMPVAWASSFDPAVVERATRISAVEATAHGIHWTFAPMVDIARDPRWGRIVEGAGEDPYLGSVMAAAQVRGLQQDSLSANNTLAATAKHYVAYGAAMAGRDYNTADISKRTLHEIYLPPFHAAVEAGVSSVMAGFNEIAGTPMHAHGELINGVLRDEWGFTGPVISDYTGIMELMRHGIAATPDEAASLALRAGVDMDLVSDFYLDLADDVRSGRVDESLVDQSVRRVLELKRNLGLFEDPYRYSDTTRQRELTATEEHRTVARELARKSIVLLKNDSLAENAGSLLPLPKDLERIAVIGPLADDARATLGTWTGSGRVELTQSLLSALRDGLTETEFVYEPGLRSAVTDDTTGLGAATALAATADAVIMVLGEPENLSAEARSRASIDLPGRQLDLAKTVIGTGTPVVVVLMNGRPLAIPWLAEYAPAILETWYLGVEHGPAVVDVLFGDYNPGGRLPVTFPRATGQIPITYDHKNTGRPPLEKERFTSKYLDVHWTPQYPFGHGLSYTTFEYSDLVIRQDADRTVTVVVRVTNTGDRAGDEVVQLYVRDDVASMTPRVKRLRRFSRIHLESGSSKVLLFRLNEEDFQMLNKNLEPVVEPGTFTISVGGSSEAVLSAQVELAIK